IWKQRPWDYEYLLDLIDHKLKEMQVEHENDRFALERNKNAIVKRIKTTRAHINKYQNSHDLYPYCGKADFELARGKNDTIGFSNEAKQAKRKRRLNCEHINTLELWHWERIW